MDKVKLPQPPCSYLVNCAQLDGSFIVKHKSLESARSYNQNKLTL